MSTTEPADTMAEPWDAFDASPSLVRTMPAAAPIVPKDSIAGRSLTVVVAIMQNYGATVPALFAMIGVATLLVAAAIWRTMPAA